MDAALRHSMLRYYDERAHEYEEAYVLGTGTASMSDRDVFRREASMLADVVERCVSGRMIDLACGTGYWLSSYAARCSSITLIDQAPRMLGEARKKVAALEAGDRTSVIEGDVLEHSFEPRAYDSALIGFLLSHVTAEQEQQLFDRLQIMLDDGGRFLILDSAWSLERARVNNKIETQERRLNDGARFEVYKRYIDRQDIVDWSTRYRVALSIQHFGTAFVAVAGSFEG